MHFQSHYYNGNGRRKVHEDFLVETFKRFLQIYHWQTLNLFIPLRIPLKLLTITHPLSSQTIGWSIITFSVNNRLSRASLKTILQLRYEKSNYYDGIVRTNQCSRTIPTNTHRRTNMQTYKIVGTNYGSTLIAPDNSLSFSIWKEQKNCMLIDLAKALKKHYG